MAGRTQVASGERAAIVQWAARMGAVTAEALAERCGSSVASARARLGAAERDRLLSRHRLLVDEPALYAITRAGLTVSGLHGLEACRVSAANAAHLGACVGAAVALERCYPDHRVLGERELRLAESERGIPVASARMPGPACGATPFHRPDLALCPAGPDRGRPIAVEVELTVKAPRRLASICLAWTRSRDVEGVLYLARPAAERALLRAVEAVDGGERIVVAPLEALLPRADPAAAG